MRVALLTNILTPYRLPVYRDLAATPGWELRILVCAASDPSWQSAYDGAHQDGCATLDVEIVPGASLRRRVRTHREAASAHWETLHVPWGVPASLRRFAPDVVVSGELGGRTLLAALHARQRRIPLVIWSYHARSGAAAAGPLRRMLRRALLSRADAVVGMGIQAREVLQGLGVAPDRLFDAPNAHDSDGWTERIAALDPLAERVALRAALGAREQIALVVGRLEAAKGIAALLAAWNAQPESLREQWTLLFVGDGTLAPAIERASAQAPRGEIARLPAMRPDQLARIYVASDLLVFASLADPWGLVVNEAMACGLPVLCSRLAGCADDLVAPGENGWLFDPTDAAGFRGALGAALADPARGEMGARARDVAKRFGPAIQAQGLRRAIALACAPR